MVAGTALGDTCGRPTATGRCPGTMQVVATGQRHRWVWWRREGPVPRGGIVQVLGCTTCWTILRPDTLVAVALVDLDGGP